MTGVAVGATLSRMLDSLLRTPGAGLRYLVENDAFVIIQPLSASSFVTLCKDRGIDIDLERLERLERLGIFFPFARVEYPRINIKVERIGTDGVRFHGMLQDGETWKGELREENSRFSWRRDWAMSWIEAGALWDPRERPFEPWTAFRDGSWEPRIQSFYTPFQAFAFHSLMPWLTMRVPADLVIDWPTSDAEEFARTLTDWSTKTVADARTGLRSEDAAFIAQLIANRYYFHTQGDRRTIRVSDDPFEKWDWRTFTRTWDATTVAHALGVSAEKLAEIHLDVSFLAASADPLERWYELVSFISVEKREQLKDDAKLAQLGYSIEHMLRLFYRDLTGKHLREPHERHAGVHVEAEELNDRESLLRELEYLVNAFHLNPKPQLILVVEGDGEAVELPRLSLEFLGYDFAQLGVEVRNLRGIANFTGAKTRDPLSALEKFIDDHHSRQTIVFCILDREGRADRVKERLVAADSQFVSGRKLTCDEYIYLWEDSIEFDNFSDDEIALAMTNVGENRYVFTAAEVAAARSTKAVSGNPLNALYQHALAYDLNKVRLLHELFDEMITNAEYEHTAKPPRPIISVLYRAIELAARNHQPVNRKLWQHNQKSGYLGPVQNSSTAPASSSATNLEK